MDEIVKIDDDIEKTGVDDDKLHNGKPITRIEISPNEKYLVTYSEDDHSILGWDVNNKVEGQLEPDSILIVLDENINQICVSDDMKLVYIYKPAERSQISKYIQLYLVLYLVFI